MTDFLLVVIAFSLLALVHSLLYQIWVLTAFLLVEAVSRILQYMAGEMKVILFCELLSLK